MAPGGRHLVRVDKIEVTEGLSAEESLLGCTDGGDSCLPTMPSHESCFFTDSEVSKKTENFDQLTRFIVGGCCEYDTDPPGTFNYEGTDGWYLEFPGARERNIGQATLLGGLVTFTTYQPYDDVCLPEGEAYLYALYYQTGTAWHTSVFNTNVGLTGDEPPKVVGRLDIGRGLATTPNLHVGSSDGTKAFVQTSTGAIVEIQQPTLPIKETKSGRTSWQCN